MDSITTGVINVNPRALDEKLQVVTKNHLLVICIFFGFTNAFLYTEVIKTNMIANESKDKNFERIISVNEKSLESQDRTNASINRLINTSEENGKKIDKLIDKTK